MVIDEKCANKSSPPTIWRDETEAFRIVEPFYCTGCHCALPKLTYNEADLLAMRPPFSRLLRVLHHGLSKLHCS